MIYCKSPFWMLATLLVVILCQQSATAQTTTNDLPKQLIDLMSTREMRYHHFLWHNLRNVWYDLDNKTQTEIKKLGWAPPRPAYTKDHVVDKNNDSGEDFLYMHRDLITQANKIMSKYSKAKKIVGFKTLPAPGDKDYPVPRGGNNENYEKWKNDDFYLTKIKPAEEKFKNPDYLRTLTLGQLGATIEFSIHNYLHIRFSNTSSNTRPSSSNAMPYIDMMWDSPSYDWLLDTYASHVNPVFWKIHGWVDDRIEDWRKANKITTIKWKGKWLGGPKSKIQNLLDTTDNDVKSRSMQMAMEEMEGMDHSTHNKCAMRRMEKAIKLLLQSERCFYYYCYGDDVKL